MNAPTIAKKISPMLAVANMEETIVFYKSVLGFTPTRNSPEYSIVERDGQTIHFMKAASEEVMTCVRGIPRYTSRFVVSVPCGNTLKRLRIATESEICLRGNTG